MRTRRSSSRLRRSQQPMLVELVNCGTRKLMLCCESLSEVATRMSLPAPCEAHLPCLFRMLFGSGEPNILHDSEPISSLERNVGASSSLRCRCMLEPMPHGSLQRRDAIRLAPFASVGCFLFATILVWNRACATVRKKYLPTRAEERSYGSPKRGQPHVVAGLTLYPRRAGLARVTECSEWLRPECVPGTF